MKRARVKVYFYDEEQILVEDEEGREKNFINLANENVEKRTLTGAFRMPYADLIRKLLKGDNVTLPSSFFKVHDHIDKMLDSIRNKNGKKALICAFTESEGDRDNVNSPKNIRIGYPLQSSFDLYKNKNLKITWLMNEKTEYPKYWSGEFKDPLSRCSCVYGAQGFEADYVGVVWGRDLVWRGKWVVNTSPITDNVGGKQYSLKVIAKKNVQKALELLRNRYYIMLTRGIREVHIFVEDDMTREYLKSITRSP
ncbi:DNA/RNA helicase domain-containing protein [Sulfolobus tengchongensis]|uniref:DNA/RNA helicase domain-containing protein n=1 Tax=Sulfolobus tengchongensis TaxID=207809 RepID=A0AAX4L5Z7_9CREN